jgi:hypothetical protein
MGQNKVEKRLKKITRRENRIIKENLIEKGKHNTKQKILNKKKKGKKRTKKCEYSVEQEREKG